MGKGGVSFVYGHVFQVGLRTGYTIPETSPYFTNNLFLIFQRKKNILLDILIEEKLWFFT